MYYDRQKKDYDYTYGAVLGMSNRGLTPCEISDALDLPKWFVIDILQKGYGRALVYKRRKMESQ